MSKFWNEHVNSIEPYVPGEQPKDKKYIKLNTNENPYPPSPKVIDAIKKAQLEDLKLYPDPVCSDLTKALSEFYNVAEDEIFLGNGSDEVLAMSFMTFFSKDKKILFPDISYSFYPVYAEMFNLDYELIKLDDKFNIPLEQFNKDNGGIILPNPNAPTARYIDCENLINLLENNPDHVVIIDEAYVDFGGESMVQYINKYPNLLVIQTFSKSRSLAGLRIGFAIGNKELIDGLNRVKNSFNSYTLDRIALISAVEAVKDKEYFEETRKKIINTREKYISELEKIGFEVIPSKANFVFAKHNSLHGEFLYKALKDNGILVRYFNKERINDYLRITIGTDEEMEQLILTLKNKILK